MITNYSEPNLLKDPIHQLFLCPSSGSYLESLDPTPLILTSVSRCWGPDTNHQLYLDRARKTGGQGRCGLGGGRHITATHIAFLKQVGVIPAVVKQSLPCVPHITKKTEVDVGISSCTFEFSCAYGHTVAGHWQTERGTPLVGCLCSYDEALHPWWSPTSAFQLLPRRTSFLNSSSQTPLQWATWEPAHAQLGLDRPETLHPINHQKSMGNVDKNSNFWGPLQTSQTLTSGGKTLKAEELVNPFCGLLELADILWKWREGNSRVM